MSDKVTFHCSECAATQDYQLDYDGDMPKGWYRIEDSAITSIACSLKCLKHFIEVADVGGRPARPEVPDLQHWSPCDPQAGMETDASGEYVKAKDSADLVARLRQELHAVTVDRDQWQDTAERITASDAARVQQADGLVARLTAVIAQWRKDGAACRAESDDAYTRGCADAIESRIDELEANLLEFAPDARSETKG